MNFKSLMAVVIALVLIVLSSRVFAEDSCFPYDVAYVERLTVIREQPGLQGRAIGIAERELGRPVLDAKHVSGDCWAQIAIISEQVSVQVGWLLADYLTAEPVPSPTKPTAPMVTWLRIKGDVEFKAEIARGLAYLHEEARRWYRYVTQYPYSIVPASPEYDRSAARCPEQRMYIHEDDFDDAGMSPMRLASVLVHEACHIHQCVEGRMSNCDDGAYAIVRDEYECVSRQLEMVLDIDPEHANVDEWVYVLTAPYEPFAQVVMEFTCRGKSQ